MDRRIQPILIVEDSEADYQATVRALARSGVRNPIYRCADGDDALDFLYRRGAYASRDRAPRPGIVLLDLNLPGTDGREVLSDMRGDEQLRGIPVVVLTTSDDERDVDACYRAGANSYIQKPVGLDALMTAVARIKEYWFDLVLMPNRRRC